MHPAERNIVAYHSTPVPIRIVHEVDLEGEKSTSNIRQINAYDLELLETPSTGEPGCIIATRQIVVNVMCETQLWSARKQQA